MPTPTLAPATSGYNDIIARAVAARFGTRPTLRSQTARLLKDNLLEQYPELDFDPYRTKIAQPIPDGAWRLTLFLDAVLEFLASGTPPDLNEQYGRACFLSNRVPARLTVGRTTSREPHMPVIAGVIRELPSILYIALQEALTTYWNDTTETGACRWQWLGDLLAGSLKSAATRLYSSNRSHADILLELTHRPDTQERREKPWSKGPLQAFTLQTQLTKGQVSVTLQTPDILVACDETYLLCNVNGVIESYPSLHAFGQAWCARFEQDFVADAISWKRFEPDGNIFDTQAALLLNQQLENLSALQLPARQPLAELEKRVDSITDVAALFIGGQTALMNLEPLHRAIPDWLQAATPTDRMAYHKHTLALASIKQQTQGRSFLDGIDDLRTFTEKALHRQMLEDQPQAPGYKADELELTFHVPVGDLGSGYIEPVKMSLTDLAINNLASKPKGRMTIRHTADQLIQDWLTDAYLLNLVSRVDVGKQYPQLIETLLLGDSAEARERARLFGLELAIGLPLLALELAIKGENGFSRRGYRYVDALMGASAAERIVDDQAIVIRPLAFLRKPGADADVVSNMFIIEPKDLSASGPRILYRPLYTPALQAFASRQQLSDAIAHSGPLQASVLTWLPDRARPIYDHNGFNEPHLVHFHPGDEFSPPTKPGPALLAGDESASAWLAAVAQGRLLESLFSSNARALVDLADRQSVSNAESRWAIILEGSWLVFNNLLLPLLRGPAILVGWMLQISHSLINDLPALSSEDAATRNQAWVDVLLNLGLVLLHVARGQGEADAAPVMENHDPALTLSVWRRPLLQLARMGETPATEQSPGLPSEPPGSGNTLLDFNLSTARDSASARLLDKLLTLHIPWPASLPEPKATGPFKGLYQIDGKWHASLAGLLFRVSIVRGFGEVYLVHPDHPGIKLKTTGDGKWTLDQGLKLLGGGPKTRIAAERKKRQERIARLNVQRQAFLDQQVPTQKRVDIAENLMQLKKNLPASSEQERAQFRQRFATELDKQTQSYRMLLADTRELSTLSDTPADNQLIVGLLENIINNARKQLVIADLDRTANNHSHPDFSSGIESLFHTLVSEGIPMLDRYFAFIRKTSEINEVMISNYEEVDRRLEELKQIPRLGAETWRRLTENRSENENTALRIKGFQIVLLGSLSTEMPGSEIGRTLDNTLSPLVLLARSHAELQDSTVYDSHDRIAVLDNLVERYNKAQDALESIGIFSADELKLPAFNRLREIIDQMRVDAERRLAEELQRLPQAEEPTPPETSTSAGKPSSRPPSASGNRKKVIKTTKGALIGEIRPRVANQGGDIVDIRGPMDSKPMASFHEHSPDVWVEIVETRPSEPERAPVPYDQLKGDARKALVQVDRQVQKIEGYAQRASSPKEVEEQLQREAQKLARYADNLKGHENAPSATDKDLALITGLRDKARLLENKATQLRTRMTLAQPPTSEGVEYLLGQNQLYAHAIGSRVQLKTGRKDFLQEYTLLNRQNQPLWYAHFHYAGTADAPTHYTQAHLKTRAQRFETYESALAKAADAKQKIDIHRAMISKGLAESRFLPLEPR